MPGGLAAQQPETVAEHGGHDGEAGQRQGADSGEQTGDDHGAPDDLSDDGKGGEQTWHGQAEGGHLVEAFLPVAQLVYAGVEKYDRKTAPQDKDER